MSRPGRGVSARDWDESDVRVRPNKKGSRPRTKDRPAHEDAVQGRVITVDRGRYTVHLPQDAHGPTREVSAMRARELRRQPVVTGDLVGLVGDLSGAEGTLSRIVRIEDRETVLRRSADDSDAVERVVVANVDTLVIMVAAANPEPRTGFIDRALVAAYDAGIEPVLCITKTDLKDPAELLAAISETWPAGGPQPVLSVLNEALLDAPELINEDAYGAWIVKVKDVTGIENLLNADQYADLIKEA